MSNLVTIILIALACPLLLPLLEEDETGVARLFCETGEGAGQTELRGGE